MTQKEPENPGLKSLGEISRQKSPQKSTAIFSRKYSHSGLTARCGVQSMEIRNSDGRTFPGGFPGATIDIRGNPRGQISASEPRKPFEKQILSIDKHYSDESRMFTCMGSTSVDPRLLTSERRKNLGTNFSRVPNVRVRMERKEIIVGSHQNYSPSTKPIPLEREAESARGCRLISPSHANRETWRQNPEDARSPKPPFSSGVTVKVYFLDIERL